MDITVIMTQKIMRHFSKSSAHPKGFVPTSKHETKQETRSLKMRYSHPSRIIFALFIAATLLALPAVAGDKNKVQYKDIFDTAVAAGSFNTLVAAVKAADLVDTLKGDGPFTVFAPTDEAFAKLPEGTVEALLQDKEKLAAILTYHVVSGTKKASDVVGAKSLTTVEGGQLNVDTSSGVQVGGANVVQADIHTSNGVIHVIDTVLLPPAN